MNWNITDVRNNKREWILKINGLTAKTEGASLHQFLNKTFGLTEKKK